VDILESSGIQQSHPGLVMHDGGTTDFKGHILAHHSSLRIVFRLITPLQQCQSEDECGETSYDIVLVRTWIDISLGQWHGYGTTCFVLVLSI
jgi:hypothetical protein